MKLVLIALLKSWALLACCSQHMTVTGTAGQRTSTSMIQMEEEESAAAAAVAMDTSIDLNSHSQRSISDIIGYIANNFLENCGLYLLFDPRNMEEEARLITEELAKPMMLLSLSWSGEYGTLELANDMILTPYRTCSAYIILSDDPEGLRHLILSSNFESHLNYLGRYVFVTGSVPGSPKVILDNEVMGWRPHAIVVREIKKDGVAANDRRADYEIWSHRVFRQDLSEVVYLVERWAQGRTQRNADLFPDKLVDFHHNELKAVTFEHAPSIIELPHEGKPASVGHHYDGIDIRLLHMLSEVLNFRLHIMNPSDGGKWGSPNDDGSWSGLTGDLMGRKAHMGVANLFIHIHYLKVVDMTVPYDMEFGCFITPLPEALPQWVALVYPFSSEVWIYALVALALGILMLCVTSRLALRCLEDESSWARNLYQIVFYGLAIFFGQSMPQEPRSDVTRSYFIMWVWYGVLITVVYKSSLTAFLTIPLAQPPIDTLEQLVSSSLPAWGAIGLTFKKMLQENPDPMVQLLAQRYKPVASTEEGLHLTAERKYALMENRQFLEYMIASNYTNRYGEERLHVVRECFLPFRIGMAMPKKAPYKPNFDAVVTRIVEGGLVRKWFKDILFISQNRGGAGEGEGRVSGALTLNNLQGAWLVLGSGFLISVVMFLSEKFIRSSRETNSAADDGSRSSRMRSSINN